VEQGKGQRRSEAVKERENEALEQGRETAMGAGEGQAWACHRQKHRNNGKAVEERHKQPRPCQSALHSLLPSSHETPAVCAGVDQGSHSHGKRHRKVQDALHPTSLPRRTPRPPAPPRELLEEVRQVVLELPLPGLPLRPRWSAPLVLQHRTEIERSFSFNFLLWAGGEGRGKAGEGRPFCARPSPAAQVVRTLVLQHRTEEDGWSA